MALCLLLFAVGTAVAETPQVYDIELRAQSVADALTGLSEQTGVPVVFPYDLVKSRTAHPVAGRYTLSDALGVLLQNTGLSGGLSDKGVITVSLVKPETPKTGETVVMHDHDQQNSNKSRATRPVGVAAFLASIAAAFSAAAQDAADTSADQKMESVIVTAQKREERAQDAPVSITVVDPTNLAVSGENRLVDYYATVPGLNVSSNAYGGGTQYLTIRGLSTGFSENPTVAVMIDGVPTGSSSALAFGMISSPDLDPSDLARIEVLKGPQGTLYGADSLGGLINYVTQDPSTSAVSGRTEVSGVDIPSGGLGYTVRAAVNLPLSDELAIRASAFSRRDPGYINDITTGQDNVNSADAYGGHLAALWRPSENFSLKLSALLQQVDGNGSAFVNYQLTSTGSLQPTNGYREQTGLPGTGPYTTQEQLYTATLKANLAGVDLVSVTGYGINKLINYMDNTASFGGSDPLTSYSEQEFSVAGSAEKQRYQTDKVSEELRLSSSVSHWLDWLIGGFYTRENSPNSYQSYNANVLSTGAEVGVMFFASYSPVTVSEHAVFGDLTFHITDQFDVQVAGRESWNNLDYASVFTGPLVEAIYNANPQITPLERASGDAFTYLITPEFKFSKDLMAYARVATGYRIGGPNLVSYPGVPSSYAPDKTTNYELGIKGDTLNHRISFDAAAYYIDWKNFQADAGYTLSNGAGVFYETNAGNAKSEGLELSIQTRPAQGLTVSLEGSYNDAALTENPPLDVVNAGLYASAGAPLPYSIRWSGGVVANQEIPVFDNWIGNFGGQLNYVSGRYGEFVSVLGQPRAVLPPYAMLNLHVGARHDSWLINLYVNNVDDRRGILGVLPVSAIGADGGYYATIMQPRTIGLSISKNF